MKFLFVIPTILTTGGIITTSTLSKANENVNFSNNVTKQKDAEQNISIKNIVQIQQDIEKSKKENKLEDLQREVIARFNSGIQNLIYDDSTNIQIITTTHQSNIETGTNRIKQQHKDLEELFSKQIKLAKEKQVYEEIKQHFTTNVPTNSEWKIATDSTTSNCKIEKNTSSSTVATVVDACSYGWQILLISLEDKIKNLLVDESSLLTKFNNINTTN